MVQVIYQGRIITMSDLQTDRLQRFLKAGATLVTEYEEKAPVKKKASKKADVEGDDDDS